MAASSLLKEKLAKENKQQLIEIWTNLATLISGKFNVKSDDY
jgi:hypothetical protein